ncbi:ricin-type beta-trefoil lectin domain protein [Streptomyces sp. NPDC090106]|uniref:ricin-type beta-trefoil lectin domain protein n=1 Tax=Streptomyces sp. NPDC090106 TaxID=3365946 RepID=UPI0037F80A2A
MPRLSQISSLGFRGNAGHRGSAADVPAGGFTAERPGDNFARRGDATPEPAPDLAAGLEPAARREGDKARREGLRGALGVVGVVSLLAVGGVALTLGLVGGDDESKRDESSVSVGSDGHDSDLIDGLGTLSDPSARASAGDAGKKPDGDEKPTGSPSPSGSRSGGSSATPDPKATGPAKDKAGTSSATQTAVPGVGVYSHASERCVDVVGGKAVQGAKLMIWDCNQSASQHWTYTGGTMRTLGMCVQLAGGSTDDGTDIELASCNGGAAQQFDLNVRHDIVNSLADKCMDVRDNQTANGSRLQLWSCSGSPNQKWSSS